ncbi:MAG: Methionyl-tRNA formyltransferase [uncultured Truepera sp.]|uniref:Methionyl-tRNA formyltransferase n=1 Tax=uncultured Truepera sp. TaxID=543023 RepID=A0A6J4V0F7_9DEIN|nr:MAG: Methionyl-tRNA formyltransferase [uncultured Truepera sp.]
MRVALFGSPAFALPVLDALLARHVVALVVAQPDKPAGRGNKLTPPPVAERARALGLRLEQPARLKRNEAFFNLLRDLDVDVAITAAYGKILPQALLDIPKHGFLNVHASLLPKYRGAAPIQWALIDGEMETGVSIMQTEAGLDTGPVRFVERLEMAPGDTAVTLFDKLSTLGADALIDALAGLERGDLPSCPQDDTQATHAPLLSKGDGAIRWDKPAAQIYNRYRGVVVWPGTWTVHDGRVLKVQHLTPLPSVHGEPGEVVAVSPEGVTVGSGEGAVLLKTVQPAGKPRMPARDWANGYGVKVGTRLGGEHG